MNLTGRIEESEVPGNREAREALGLPWLEMTATEREPLADVLERASAETGRYVLMGHHRGALVPPDSVLVGWFWARRSDPRLPLYVIDRGEMMTPADVSAALGVTLRRAQQLVAEHPEAKREGARWQFPRRSLDDLRARSTATGWPKGRPRKPAK